MLTIQKSNVEWEDNIISFFYAGKVVSYLFAITDMKL